MHHFCLSQNLNKNGQHLHLSNPYLWVENNLRSMLIEKYSLSQVYFQTQLIDKLLLSKSGIQKQKERRPESIKMKDIEFDEEDEFMDKFYTFSDTQNELPELFEYYKYYTQQPICYLQQQYDIMFQYQQRKKAYLYNKLKKVLELSDTTKSLQSLEKVKNEGKQALIGNVLSFLNHTRKGSKFIDRGTKNQDQSYCFKEISEKLNKLFGPSRLKTINKIDRNFKFFGSNFSFHRPKKGSEIIKNPTPKTMLESTNVSSKNVYIKKNQKTSKIHKRYGSTEINKSQNQVERKKIKRRSSMQFIKTTQSSNVDQKKEEIKQKKGKIKQKKKEEEKNLNCSSISSFVDVKLNIEEIKRKINKEKELIRKGSPKPIKMKRK